MTDDIATLLGELHNDHRNMRVLLDLLEQECNAVYDGRQADFELLHDIMDYMTVYPDAVHHPKEDRIYAEMRAVRPDLTLGFQRISLDHQRIGEQGRRIRDAVAAVEQGTVVSRRALVGDMLRYADNLRSHMQWEELDLFRRCREMVRDGHTLLIEEASHGHPDPLFDEAAGRRYAHLLQRIAITGERRIAAGPERVRVPGSG